MKAKTKYLFVGLLMLNYACTNKNDELNSSKDQAGRVNIDSASEEKFLSPKPVFIDGIKAVKIGNQVWMLDNLNVDTFRNGDLIPHAETDKDWFNAGLEQKPAWSYYDNNDCYGQYGRLYNFFAVDDPRELAPKGWRIPTDEDWIRLKKNLKDNFGDKLKSEAGWFNDGSGTNESGFTGYPGGIRDVGGLFSQYGFYGYWWTSSSIILDRGYTYYLVHDYGDQVFRGMVTKRLGMSVRCIKDYENPDSPCN